MHIREKSKLRIRNKIISVLLLKILRIKGALQVIKNPKILQIYFAKIKATYPTPK